MTFEELEVRFSMMLENAVQCLVDLRRESEPLPDVFTALEA
jgi:hypothetical protein